MRATKWLDIGSGGGFPGLIIGVVIAGRPGASIDLVESNRKKCAFLQAVVGELGLPARVHSKRIEDVHGAIAAPEILTRPRARAPAAAPGAVGAMAGSRRPSRFSTKVGITARKSKKALISGDSIW